MIRISTFILAITVLHPIAFAADPSVQDSLVLGEVRKLAESMTDGVATMYDEYVKIKYTDLSFTPGDKMDAVVLFSMEGWHGGNGYYQFVAVFVHGSNDGWAPHWQFHEFRLAGVTRVGMDYERSFDDFTVEGDLIYFTGSAWTDKDAHCCPTGTAKATFQINEYSIIEVLQNGS